MLEVLRKLQLIEGSDSCGNRIAYLSDENFKIFLVIREMLYTGVFLVKYYGTIGLSSGKASGCKTPEIVVL